MNQYLSDKFRVISLLSAILVLYIHSGFHDNEIQGMPINHITQNVISGSLGSMAVPVFYILSGFLFFLKVPSGMLSIFQKMRKRIHTILIPYLIGCTFCLLFFIATATLPGVSRFMNGEFSLLSLPLPELLWTTFVGEGHPLAFQLWFLQDLIVIVAFAPLLYIALTRMKWAFAILAFVASIATSPTTSIATSLFWSSLGGLIALSPSRDKIINLEISKSRNLEISKSRNLEISKSIKSSQHFNNIMLNIRHHATLGERC